MKYLLSVLMVALITTTIFAQDGWTTVSNPDPQMHNLKSVTATPNGTIHTVGEYGTYMINTGSGFEMQPYPGNNSSDYKKIVAIDDNLLYMCGASSHGVINKSTNGGIDWTSTIFENNPLNDMAFWAPDSGIAVGENGLILRTTDGGTNWIQLTSPESLYLESVNFSSNGQVGIIVGQNGTILRSNDSGATWTQVNSPTSLWLSSVNLTNDGQIGIIVGESGILIRSTDGGTSWNEVSSPTSMGLPSINLSNNGQVGIAVGQNGTIINTTDSGTTWTTMTSGVPSLLLNVIILPDYSAWIVGSEGTILYNPDIPLSIEIIDNQVPSDFQLMQNYPNPFNPNTNIEYSMPVSGIVTVNVYNVLGQTVTMLANEFQPAGTYRISWNGANLPSGVYFYQIKTNTFSKTKSMVLLK